MPMLPLSNGELHEMRGEIAATLPTTADLFSPSRVSDGQGGFVVTYALVQTVAARLDPEVARGNREAENIVSDRVAEVNRYTLTIPYSTTIDASWRVRVQGTTYEVMEVQTHYTWSLHKRVRVVEVD